MSVVEPNPQAGPGEVISFGDVPWMGTRRGRFAIDKKKTPMFNRFTPQPS